MRIGIIGAGSMGQIFARHVTHPGHEVFVTFVFSVNSSPFVSNRMGLNQKATKFTKRGAEV
jgi:3-hydroxyisobutyrate dehydrogenase-like beta-hydroxyacid dehydrogenase